MVDKLGYVGVALGVFCVEEDGRFQDGLKRVEAHDVVKHCEPTNPDVFLLFGEVDWSEVLDTCCEV